MGYSSEVLEDSRGNGINLNMGLEMSEEGKFAMQVDCEYFSGVEYQTQPNFGFGLGLSF